MYRMFLAIITLLAGGALLPRTAPADVIDSAYVLCSTLESEDIYTVQEGEEVNAECKVNGRGSTVDYWINTTASEARRICTGVADLIAEALRSHPEKSFAGKKWKLRIFSSYGGEHPIATCILH